VWRKNALVLATTGRMGWKVGIHRASNFVFLFC
jgi:hypothetical protein